MKGFFLLLLQYMQLCCGDIFQCVAMISSCSSNHYTWGECNATVSDAYRGSQSGAIVQQAWCGHMLSVHLDSCRSGEECALLSESDHADWHSSYLFAYWLAQMPDILHQASCCLQTSRTGLWDAICRGTSHILGWLWPQFPSLVACTHPGWRQDTASEGVSLGSITFFWLLTAELFLKDRSL